MASPGRKVLICMDGSKESDFAFSWFLANIYRKTDHLMLVHVHEREKSLHTAIGTGDLQSNLKTVTLILQHEKEETERLEKHMQNILHQTGMKGHVITVKGHASAGTALTGIARADGVSVIVCGTRGMGTLRRTFLGSVSSYLLHHAHVPVVVCKVQSKSESEK